MGSNTTSKLGVSNPFIKEKNNVSLDCILIQVLCLEPVISWDHFGLDHIRYLSYPILAEIKPVYYPGEEGEDRLVSLDLLKLYSGEDVVQQNPEDTDPDHW